MRDHRTSRFEQLMGNNLDELHIMLEGALKDWQGSYDILPIDTEEYLRFPTGTDVFSDRFSKFCAHIRQSKEGEARCLECDLDGAAQAGKYKQPVIYPCHAGLQDIAVPIVVSGELVAVVFCGQARLRDQEWDQAGEKDAREVAEELGIPADELLALRGQVRSVSYEEMTEAAQRIFRITSFVSKMLETNQELRYANQELRRISGEQEERNARHTQIEKALADVIPLAKTCEELWLKLDQLLDKLATILRADHAAILFQEPTENGETIVAIKAETNMPAPISRGRTYERDDLFDAWEERKGVYHSPIEDTVPGTLSYEVQKATEEIGSPVHTRVSVPIRVDDNARGGIALFFQGKKPAPLDVEEEGVILSLVASRVGRAYRNTAVYLKEVAEEEERRKWVRRLCHQVISPLNGLMGYAENLRQQFYDRRLFTNLFGNWKDRDLAFWENSLDSVIATADWSARLTRNLAWMMKTVEERRKLILTELNTVQDAGQFFVDIARFIQGLAREREVGNVNVDRGSFASLDGRLHVHQDTFRQAILNILDNAVKYSNKNTHIVIRGRRTNGHFRIEIENRGIQLRRQECERIFEPEYRTEVARRRHPTGSGVGLAIAREIVELHGGTLTAKPSVKTYQGWETTFTILIPLRKPG